MSHSSMDIKGRFDSTLFALVMTLAAISVTMLLSISQASGAGLYWKKQLIWFGLGLGGMVAITVVPRRFWYHASFYLYGLFLIPLAMSGVAAKGAERWFALGGFHFQPSEFAKLGVLLTLARLFSNRRVSLSNLKPLILPFFVFVIPFFLILKQPNLSTALSVSMVFFVMLYWSGFSLLELLILISPVISVAFSFEFTWWALFNVCSWVVLYYLWRNRKIPGKIAIIFGCLILAAGLMSQVAWNTILHEHQRSRILTFMSPMRDPSGAGYQVLQSQVAIGSGGLWGKGYGQGSQSLLQFLPEQHTDFIFCVIAEQFGFLGCLFVLSLLFAFLVRSLWLCFDYSDRFFNLVTVGCVAIFSFHTMVNICMTLGLMPVTGLPLPFLSYGGSFVITCMLMVGFLLHIRLGDAE